MHLLVELHGQPGWVAALTLFSVDELIAAASTALLANPTLWWPQCRGAHLDQVAMIVRACGL
jgi:hypothetical protein